MKKKPNIGRPCEICRHSQIKQINAAIAKPTSFRDVAARFGVSKSAVGRHVETCLKQSVSALIEKQKERQAINVHKEFEDNLAFARSLRVAAQEYLADPDDPLKMAIIPRVEEIDVVYLDHDDLCAGLNPRPKRKIAKLGFLLQKTEEIRNIEVDKVNIRHVDLRSFALDAIKAVDTCVDKFAKLGGLYQGERENERTFQKVLGSYELWSSQNPNASAEQKAAAIETIARGGNVDAKNLADRVGVQLISEMSQ